MIGIGTVTGGGIVLPAGGAAGQAVVKSSGVNGATTWGAAYPGGYPPYTSGVWYDTRHTAAGSTSSGSASGSLYVPLFLPRPVTINALGFYGYGGVAGNAQFGVYSLAANLTPGNLIGSVAVALPASAQAVTGAAALTIPAGWSMLAVASDVGTLIYFYSTQSSTVGSVVAPWSQQAGAGTPTANAAGSCWPSTATTLASNPSVGALMQPAPTLYFRAA